MKAEEDYELQTLPTMIFYRARKPSTSKAGHLVTETQKPTQPVYVFDLPMTTLKHLPIETKKTQHQVIFKNSTSKSIRQRKHKKPWTQRIFYMWL